MEFLRGFNWQKINTNLELFRQVNLWAAKRGDYVLWSSCEFNADLQRYEAEVSFYSAYDEYGNPKEYCEFNWQEGYNWFPTKLVWISVEKHFEYVNKCVQENKPIVYDRMNFKNI